MSIRVMTLIWDTCLYQAGTLNVLLAMADHASDNGRDIYPGMEYLAAKCRQTVRATILAVKRLRADRVLVLLDQDGGDLEPNENPIGGRGYKATYRIDLKRVKELQGLHQDENPDCEHCKAGRKSSHEDEQKGEVRDSKGEDRDTKGEKTRSHIERTVLEPSGTSLPRADARESEVVASLGKGQAERWPEFRSAVAKSWLDGFPADDEVACRKQFERLSRLHPSDLIIACAQLHGAELRRRQAARGQKSRQHVRKPSNWLKDGDWQGYIPAATAEAAREANVATALGNVRRALGDGLFAILKARMPEASLAMLDGLALDGPQFAINRPLQRTLLEKHYGVLETHFGAPPAFVLIAERKRQ